jgi:hypothetical protein
MAPHLQACWSLLPVSPATQENAIKSQFQNQQTINHLPTRRELL